MKFHLKNDRKKAFTLLEILFVTIIISAWLLFVAEAIRHAKQVNYTVIQSVIANQLATEWIEAVYQLRNTNFLKYEVDWEFDTDVLNSCRLSTNFDWCKKTIEHRKGNRAGYSISNSDFENDYGIIEKKSFLKAGYYYITNSWWENILNNCYYEKDNDVRKENCWKIAQDIYAICQKDWTRVPCTSWHVEWNDESKYGHFYRYIEGVWSYDMSSNQTWWALIDTSKFANDKNAQEYRFCSRVFRVWMDWWNVEICSTMTNFYE